ncbi:MAG: hypothetical protein Q7S53_05355 [bacterium]|nr:hypothetical protein [bacterium]
MIILMAISADMEANRQAVEALQKIPNVEIKTVPTVKELARHVHLPFIQLEDGSNERRYGLDDILNYVDEELEKEKKWA